jgi:hypothetical protein
MRILVLLCLVVAVSGDGSALNTWTRGGMRLRGGWGEEQSAKQNIRVVQSFTEQPKRPPGWTDDREGAPRLNTHQAPGQGGLKLSQPTVGTKFTYRGPNAKSVEVIPQVIFLAETPGFWRARTFSLDRSVRFSLAVGDGLM